MAFVSESIQRLNMVYNFSIDKTEYFFDGESLQLYSGTYPNDTEENNHLVNKDESILSKVTFYVTDKCNGSCIYCYEDKGTSLMDIASADKAIEYLSSNFSAIDEVSIFGGEAFLNFPVIKHLVEELTQKIAINTFSVVSNGTLITEEHIDFMSQYNFQVTISLDGPDYIHDALRKGCPHKLVIKTIERLKQSPLSELLRINCTYTKYHEEKIGRQNLLSYFESLHVPYAISPVITNIEGLKFPEATQETFQRAIDRTYEKLASDSNNISINAYVSATINALVNHEYSNVFCPVLDSGRAFDVHGIQHSCTGLVGHVVDESSISKFNSKDNDVCNKCWARGYCFRCPIEEIKGKEEPPFLAEKCQIQESFEYALKKLVSYLQNDPDTFQLIIDNYFKQSDFGSME